MPAARLPAEPGDDAVGRLVRLHLDDAVARAGEIRQPEPLRHHAVEAGGLQRLQPRASLFHVGGDGGEGDAAADALQLGAALLDRPFVHRLPVPEEQVEGDEDRRDLRRQLADAALGRMQPHLHRVEVELAVAGDDDLAVERGAGRQQLAERAQLGEVAEERPPVARPQRQLAAVVLQHAAEAVPFRLVPPAALLRQVGDELGLHRRERNAGSGRVGHHTSLTTVRHPEVVTRLVLVLCAVALAGCGGGSAAPPPTTALLTAVKAAPKQVEFRFRSAPLHIKAGYVPRSKVVESGSGRAREGRRQRLPRRPLQPGLRRRPQRQARCASSTRARAG